MCPQGVQKSPKRQSRGKKSPSLRPPKIRVILRSLGILAQLLLALNEFEVHAWMAIEGQNRTEEPSAFSPGIIIAAEIKALPRSTTFRVISCHTTNLRLQLLQCFLTELYVHISISARLYQKEPSGSTLCHSFCCDGFPSGLSY